MSGRGVQRLSAARRYSGTRLFTWAVADRYWRKALEREGTRISMNGTFRPEESVALAVIQSLTRAATASGRDNTMFENRSERCSDTLRLKWLSAVTNCQLLSRANAR